MLRALVASGAALHNMPTRDRRHDTRELPGRTRLATPGDTLYNNRGAAMPRGRAQSVRRLASACTSTAGH